MRIPGPERFFAEPPRFPFEVEGTGSREYDDESAGSVTLVFCALGVDGWGVTDLGGVVDGGE